MKNLILATTILFINCAFASVSGLYFIEGEQAGQPVTNGTYFGYYKMCFKGDAEVVKNQALQLLKEDIEKESPFVRIDENKDQIIFGYIDTKCRDESEANSDCRSLHVIKRCE
jgi:hypothetical protein